MSQSATPAPLLTARAGWRGGCVTFEADLGVITEFTRQ